MNFKKGRCYMVKKRRKCKCKRKKEEWTAQDFVGAVWKVMERQARKNKALRKLYKELGDKK